MKQFIKDNVAFCVLLTCAAIALIVFSQVMTAIGILVVATFTLK